MDHGFLENGRRAHSKSEVSPSGSVSCDGSEKHLSLTKQSNVHRLGDDVDGTHTVGDLNQSHTVVEDCRDILVVKLGLLVVVGAKEVVIVLEDL